MHRGYIKIWRKMVEWEWYQSSDTKSVFLHLLLGANYKETSFMGHRIMRGDMVISINTLSKTLSMSPRSIRTALTRLKSTNEVTIKTTSLFSIVTLCNYGKYQSDEIINDTPNDTPNDTRPTCDRHADDTRPTYSKEINKEKNGNKENNKSATTQNVSTPEFLRQAMNGFVESRKNLKKPLGNHARLLIIQKLEKLYPGDQQKQIECLNQSTENGWQGVYELKTDIQRVNEMPGADRHRMGVIQDPTHISKCLPHRRLGHDEHGNALGAEAKPGEFDEGIITLEGVPDHRDEPERIESHKSPDIKLSEIREHIEKGDFISDKEYALLPDREKDLLRVDEEHYKGQHEFRYSK